ncbi:MAG TPA: NUDIX hydrolase [Acidimicrobiales bacterium]|nr:NUDIX hydrolase [Acidimicrobiales bacterium]
MYCSACAAALASEPPVTCENCGTSHWANPKPCSGALVTHEGKLLLVKRAHEPWKGRWDIPGGFCDPGEHPILTAIRELREETGLEIDVIGLAGMWMDVYNSDTETTLNLYYYAELAGPDEPRPDPAECEEVRWMSPEELPAGEDLAFPAQEAPVLRAWKAAIAAGGIRRTDMPDDPRRQR